MTEKDILKAISTEAIEENFFDKDGSLGKQELSPKE